MGNTDTKAIDQLASGLKGQPTLHLTPAAATEARTAVKSCADAYGDFNPPDIGGQAPDLSSARAVQSHLNNDVSAFRDKFKAVVTVLQATDSAIEGLSDLLIKVSQGSNGSSS